MKKNAFLFLLVFLLLACQNSGEVPKVFDTLPQSVGESHEIVLVMDSAKWKGKLGEEIRSIWATEQDGLMPMDPERWLTLRFIRPHSLNGLLKTAHTLIMVSSFESNSNDSRKLKSFFTEKSIQKIKGDTSIFLQKVDEQFARGQIVLQLFGQNEAILLNHLKKNKQALRNLVLDHVRQRIANNLYKVGEKKQLAADIAKSHGFKIRIPNGYDVAKNTTENEGKEGFVFIRKIDGAVDYNFFVAYKPYLDKSEVAEKNLFAWRDSIGKKHIVDPEIKQSYLVTEPLEPPIFTPINFKNKYGIEMRGLWRTSISSMGGPFVSLVVIDDKKSRMYMIDGFLYAPGKSKREMLREIETILHTFDV